MRARRDERNLFQSISRSEVRRLTEHQTSNTHPHNHPPTTTHRKPNWGLCWDGAPSDRLRHTLPLSASWHSPNVKHTHYTRTYVYRKCPLHTSMFARSSKSSFLFTLSGLFTTRLISPLLRSFSSLARCSRLFLPAPAPISSHIRVSTDGSGGGGGSSTSYLLARWSCAVNGSSSGGVVASAFVGDVGSACGLGEVASGVSSESLLRLRDRLSRAAFSSHGVSSLFLPFEPSPAGDWPFGVSPAPLVIVQRARLLFGSSPSLTTKSNRDRRPCQPPPPACRHRL